MLDNRDDVGGVSSARALGVVCVDSSTLERANGLFDEAGFIESVGVDQALHVELVADRETGVNCGGSGAPIFVELEADDSGSTLLFKALRGGVIAFTGYAEVKWDRINGLEHGADVCGRGGAGSCICAGAAGSKRGDVMINE